MVSVVLIGLLIAITLSQRQLQTIIIPQPIPTPSTSLSIPPLPTVTTIPTPITQTPAPSSQPLVDIRVSSPKSNQIITSPLGISGEARGSWFFEATAPVRLLDANDRFIANGFITAQGDWMTTNFVPFVGEISFTTPATDTGQLIMEKGNPSGLPENDRQIIIPIRFF